MLKFLNTLDFKDEERHADFLMALLGYGEK
jgi:hypothetical protein